MDLVADILLVAGALGAAFYCFVLSRRLKNFTDLEKGVGGAVAVLSAQVDDLRNTLNGARKEADGNAEALSDLTARAQTTAQKLELLMASLHDLPVQPEKPVVEKDVVSDQAETVPEVTAPKEPISKTPSKPDTPAQPMFVRHPRKRNEAAE